MLTSRGPLAPPRPQRPHRIMSCGGFYPGLCACGCWITWEPGRLPGSSSAVAVTTLPLCHTREDPVHLGLHAGPLADLTEQGNS